jgi:glucose-1-phosphatase
MISSIDPTKFEAILFDLGGVLINLDYHKTTSAFHTLGVDKNAFENLQYEQQSFMDDFEIGAISSSRFINSILPYCKQGTSPNAAVAAWNAMILDFPVERMLWLEQFSKQHATFLLSNTNELHLQLVNRRLMQSTGHTSLSYYFKETYFSHEIGARKPHVTTFLSVAEKMNIATDNILFIDDSIQHVEGAKSAGFNAVLLENKTEISSIFSY